MGKCDCGNHCNNCGGCNGNHKDYCINKPWTPPRKQAASSRSV